MCGAHNYLYVLLNIFLREVRRNDIYFIDILFLLDCNTTSVHDSFILQIVLANSCFRINFSSKIH